MCIVNFNRCPSCSYVWPIPFICPTKEIGLRKRTEDAALFWDTDCNRPGCFRKRTSMYCISPEGSCAHCQCEDQCRIDFVPTNCSMHQSRSEFAGKTIKVYKSFFRAQLNLLRSGKINVYKKMVILSCATYIYF
jgi:hypothetical protein